MKQFFLFLLFTPLLIFSQGSLVLVGGGGESNGGWSDAPYTWALDQSQNRKVAVIYYSSSTSWTPEYFMDLGPYFINMKMVKWKKRLLLIKKAF